MLFAILFAVVMLWMPNDMYGQTGDITLHVEEAPLGDVFQQIEDDYGYMFLYRDDAIDLARKVSVSVTDATIGQVLDRILDDKTGFEVNGRQVTIFLKDNRDDGTAQQASEPESWNQASNASMLPFMNSSASGTVPLHLAHPAGITGERDRLVPSFLKYS